MPPEEPVARDVPQNTSATPMFGSRKPEPTPAPLAAWAIAIAVVVLLLVLVLAFSHRAPATANGTAPANTLMPLAPQAATLSITALQMSESTSLSGGKSTYIDGNIRNNGPAAVTSVTVQVLFANDENMPPQIQTLPLTLIRTRQPYVDIEPVASEPLAPGTDHDFRLIFEGVGANWNQQTPQIHIVTVATK